MYIVVAVVHIYIYMYMYMYIYIYIYIYVYRRLNAVSHRIKLLQPEIAGSRTELQEGIPVN